VDHWAWPLKQVLGKSQPDPSHHCEGAGQEEQGGVTGEGGGGLVNDSSHQPGLMNPRLWCAVQVCLTPDVFSPLCETIVNLCSLVLYYSVPDLENPFPRWVS
jgi:hypothetical protein